MNHDNALLERTVRPTGSLKTCADCGALMPMGYRCVDCWHEHQLMDFRRHRQRWGYEKPSPARRFSDDEIRDIRSTGWSSRRAIRELCQKYKTSPNVIYGIMAHETYKDVK